MPTISALQFSAAAKAWVLNEQQRLITEKGERKHGTEEEKSGQLRWSRGNFESRKP